MFQDVQGPLAVKTWLCQHYGVQDPNVVIATAFMEWRQALDDFLKFADIAEDSPTAVALSSLALCAEGDRTCCDRGRARHLAGRAMLHWPITRAASWGCGGPLGCMAWGI